MMVCTGKMKQGEEWIAYFAPIPEPEEKYNRDHAQKSRSNRRDEERHFWLSCVEDGIITREFFENCIIGKHRRKKKS